MSRRQWQFAAQRALDLTHKVGERGPQTTRDRQQVAEWLDLGGKRIPAKAIRRLERLASITANPVATAWRKVRAVRVRRRGNWLVVEGRS